MPASSTHRFDAAVGADRGSERPSLFAERPDARARDLAAQLAADVAAGRLDETLHVLAGEPDRLAAPLAAELLGLTAAAACADAMAFSARYRMSFARMFYLRPGQSARIIEVLDRSERHRDEDLTTLHLWPDGFTPGAQPEPAEGDTVRAICGRRFQWLHSAQRIADPDDPSEQQAARTVGRARVGDWLSYSDPVNLPSGPCPDCAPLAAPFAETAEQDRSEPLPDWAYRHVRNAAVAAGRVALHTHLRQRRDVKSAAESALAGAEAAVRPALVRALADWALSQGESLMRRAFGYPGQYEQVRNQLGSELAARISRADWAAFFDAWLHSEAAIRERRWSMNGTDRVVAYRDLLGWQPHGPFAWAARDEAVPYSQR